MEEKGAGERNSAYARKGVSFCCAFFRSSFRSPNALRATVESGFLSARYVLCVVTCAPVEYLTYEIRNVSDLMRLVGVDAHIDPHPLAGAVRPTSPQSISTTSPVCPIRTCIAFYRFEIYFGRNQTPGKIQEGGRNPLLGRFKGDCKGGAPARIQRSDSRGKRRNNETDETCRLRRDEGCVVCSDANPPFAVFFLPPAAFSLPRKEKGTESFPAPFARIRRHPSDDEAPRPPGAKSLAHPPDALILRPPGAKGRHPSGDKAHAAFAA